MPTIAQQVAANQQLESSGKKVYSVPAPAPAAPKPPDEFSGAVGSPIRATIDSIIMPSSPQWQINSPLSGKGTTMRTGGIPLGALPTTANNSAQTTAKLEAAAATAQNAANEIADVTVLSTNNNGTVTFGTLGSAPRRHTPQHVLPLDNIADGPSYGKVVQTALTTNQPDLAQPGVLNKTLQYVTDNGGRFASTASGTSYRPTTNPLTSTDAGANATISVASFNLRLRNSSITSDVAYNSGSITTLSYGTLYYVYVNDPLFAGGAVTYAATTTKENVLSGAGYIFLGSVFTSVSGGGTTFGNNDGGTGAQTGNNIIVWPSANTVGGSWTNPTNAYNADPATAANSGTSASILTLSGFSSLVLPACTGITIYVDWSNVGGAAGKTAVVAYSTNGGSSYTNAISTSAAFSRTVSTFMIGTNFNPGIIQLKVTLDASWTTGNIFVYGIWLSETF